MKRQRPKFIYVFESFCLFFSILILFILVVQFFVPDAGGRSMSAVEYVSFLALAGTLYLTSHAIRTRRRVWWTRIWFIWLGLFVLQNGIYFLVLAEGRVQGTLTLQLLNFAGGVVFMGGLGFLWWKNRAHFNKD
ncbi:hypothetical protein [Parvibaculum sp. MBR-TMA-1.3b-4.2]|jgi:hypothetical protein